MNRFYVEMKKNRFIIEFYMMAYSKQQIIDMLGDEYYIITIDLTE